ncbi:MAG: hypothetical protein AAFO69_14895 [Bacteroidota bacterium]
MIDELVDILPPNVHNQYLIDWIEVENKLNVVLPEDYKLLTVLIRFGFIAVQLTAQIAWQANQNV